MLLVGDIGATHARLALISAERGLARPEREETLPSQRYDSFEAVLTEFLTPRPSAPIERAVFAVAGPVVRGRAELTNVGWVVDEERLGAAVGIGSVRLLNDLVALAYGVPQLRADALRTLNVGTREERGAIAVVAPGTGLGQAYLNWNGAAYRARPSEGGHVDFAPGDELQTELLAWLWGRWDHVSYERVCSGSGLPNLYDFLKERGTAREEPWLADRLAAAEDRTPVIVDAAFDERAPSALCVATLELFASILAAEAGNAARRRHRWRLPRRRDAASHPTAARAAELSRALPAQGADDRVRRPDATARHRRARDGAARGGVRGARGRRWLVSLGLRACRLVSLRACELVRARLRRDALGRLREPRQALTSSQALKPPTTALARDVVARQPSPPESSPA